MVADADRLSNIDLLTGANAAGKSTVLTAVLWLPMRSRMGEGSETLDAVALWLMRMRTDLF